MASEKQIRANRENAKRSTGPRTAAGRMKSSQNALRHGLSLKLYIDGETIKKIDAIVPSLVSDPTDQAQLTAAAQAAHAQLDLLRIRCVRNQMLMELWAGNLTEIRRLAALERYERVALAKRHRASEGLGG